MTITALRLTPYIREPTMHMPIIRGLIRRRILINYRVEPKAIARHLPAPFRPKLIGGFAVAGICLIRLEQIRPRGCPAIIGIASENSAHRIAVEWTDTSGGLQDGVYILRRDTGSRLNHFAGGRVFPGKHALARFEVHDSHEQVRVAMHSSTSDTSICVEGHVASGWPTSSLFPSLVAASRFHETASLGYSQASGSKAFDGLVLATQRWQVARFEVSRLESSIFADPSNFPAGSVELDHALIMRDIEHEWHTATRLCA
jgi:hypothetical protein